MSPSPLLLPTYRSILPSGSHHPFFPPPPLFSDFLSRWARSQFLTLCGREFDIGAKRIEMEYFFEVPLVPSSFLVGLLLPLLLQYREDEVRLIAGQSVRGQASSPCPPNYAREVTKITDPTLLLCPLPASKREDLCDRGETIFDGDKQKIRWLPIVSIHPPVPLSVEQREAGWLDFLEFGKTESRLLCPCLPPNYLYVVPDCNMNF